MSQVFGETIAYQHMDSSKHKGHHEAMFVRSEMCGACHDVTNALPIKNPLGKWVGGFPIERTYTEWLSSRYADRPGNTHFDPRFKRDCQSCHMQQEYGQPGTAQTLYKDGCALPIPKGPIATDAPARPVFTHHFVGGNALVPRLIGKDVDQSGNVAPYPELSTYSFSSADEKSVYSRAVWTQIDKTGAFTQQSRMAWDRLRHVLSMDVQGPAVAQEGTSAPISVTIANTGSGHNFPTGFPEGRIAWVAVHAYDLATGNELPIHDAVWDRTTLGVGGLTTEETVDPNYPGCNWPVPVGSADPYSVQFKAVASLGNGCPTLDLPYAAPLNMVTAKNGLPSTRTETSSMLPRTPRASSSSATRTATATSSTTPSSRTPACRPMPHPGATKAVDRYAVVVPVGTQGPVAVSASVYYQSVEAIVAREVPGEHGGHQQQQRPRALRSGRRPTLATVSTHHRACGGGGRAACPHDRAKLDDRRHRRARRHDAAEDGGVPRARRGPRLPGRRGEGLLLQACRRGGCQLLHPGGLDGRGSSCLGRPDRRRHLGPVCESGCSQAGRDVYGSDQGGHLRRRRQLYAEQRDMEIHSDSGG